MHLNGFMCIRMRKLPQNTRIKPIHVIEAKLCHHLEFQMSFREIHRQKSYRNCLGDRSELWPSIPEVNYSCNAVWTPKSSFFQKTRDGVNYFGK